MIEPTAILHAAGMGMLRVLFAIGAVLAYLQALVALVIIVTGVTLVVGLFV